MLSYVQDLARRTYGNLPVLAPVTVEPRFRYNQDFRSVFALGPGLIMIFMVVFSAMLPRSGWSAKGNRLDQQPLCIAGFGRRIRARQADSLCRGRIFDFLSLITLAYLAFGVTVKGSMAALGLGALIYVFAATALGILVSSFVRTQVAAIVGPQ